MELGKENGPLPPTLGNTDPEFMDKVDELQREIGFGIDGIVTGRKILGIERPLLDDVAPPITASFTPAGSDEATEVDVT